MHSTYNNNENIERGNEGRMIVMQELLWAFEFLFAELYRSCNDCFSLNLPLTFLSPPGCYEPQISPCR